MSSVKPIKNAHPPKLIETFLHWSLPAELKEPVLGDLAEEYSELILRQPLKANYWYTRQALHTGLQFLTKTKRGLIMFLFGILGFLAVVMMGMIQSGDLSMFVNVPSLLIVFPSALLITIAATSKQSRRNAYSVLFNDDLTLNKTELKAAKHVYTTFSNMNILMGVIGVIIGAIAMSSNMQDMSSFGPAFAVCLLTLFYALLMKALCFAAEAKIQFKIINLT